MINFNVQGEHGAHFLRQNSIVINARYGKAYVGTSGGPPSANNTTAVEKPVKNLSEQSHNVFTFIRRYISEKSG